MSSDHDPVRLGANPATSPWLKSLLSNAQSEASSAAIDIDRLTARVEAAILASPPLPDKPLAQGSPIKAWATSKAALVGAGVVIGMAVGTVWMLKSAPRSKPQPSASATQPGANAPATPLAQGAPVTAAPPPADNNADVPKTSAASANSPTPVRDTKALGLSEATLLDTARAALNADPRRALALTQEHARRFPHGALVQEREVIAIEAMSRLGQTDAARRRAGEFERQFPGSAHQPKIDQATRGR